jgi:hypothetical protein
MAQGPVCGMEVDEQKAAGTNHYRGRPQTQTSAHWNYIEPAVTAFTIRQQFLTGSAYTHKFYFKVFVEQGGSPMEISQGLKEVLTTFTIKSGDRFNR